MCASDHILMVAALKRSKLNVNKREQNKMIYAASAHTTDDALVIKQNPFIII